MGAMEMLRAIEVRLATLAEDMRRMRETVDGTHGRKR